MQQWNANVTKRNSLNTFLCRSVFGHVVAVRMAMTDEERVAAENEVAVYQRLRPLQGTDIPCLVAHGYTLDGNAYFVATSFVMVRYNVAISACAVRVLCTVLLTIVRPEQLQLRVIRELCWQGVPWNGNPAHRKLDGKFWATMTRIHQIGVVHKDLHPGNIIVTDNSRITVLDFASSCLDAPASELDKEQEYLELMLSTST